MAHVFKNKRRKADRRGRIKRASNRLYLAVEHDIANSKRYVAVFSTYQQAKSWMFARGLWVEA